MDLCEPLAVFDITIKKKNPNANRSVIRPHVTDRATTRQTEIKPNLRQGGFQILSAVFCI